MDKAFSGDVLKILAVLFLGGIAFYVFLISIAKRVAGGAKQIGKKQNLYLLLAALIFGLIACSAHPIIFDDPDIFLIIYQVLFLGLGILHLSLMPKVLNIRNQVRDTFWLQVSFTIAATLFGCLLFVVIFRVFNHEGYYWLMAGSILFFIIPFLVYHTFLQAVSVPSKLMNYWRYPIHQRVEEPNSESLKNMLIVTFSIQKQITDPHITKFRAKAPAGMNFGSLFYYFINDFNEKYPNEGIQYLNMKGEPQTWVFKRKRKWLSPSSIDANKTVAENRIKENDVIICTRTDM